MVNKILLKLRELLSVFLDESPGQNADQQKVTVVGSGNNITIINGNSFPDSILLNNQNKVKRFPRKNCKGSKRYQKCLNSSKRGRRS